jgi:hypothetical protein
LNLIQLYIGHIGASRAYGLHFELMDAALFLTNEGITIYLGHKHRWSRKWRVKAQKTAVKMTQHGKAAQVGRRKPSTVIAADTVAPAAGEALASLATGGPAHSPVLSVVSLAPKRSRAPAKSPVSTALRGSVSGGALLEESGASEREKAHAMAG